MPPLKPRRVVIAIECVTDLPIHLLKRIRKIGILEAYPPRQWVGNLPAILNVNQSQANVIKKGR